MPFVVVAGLVVDASWRRQGIGHALLERAEAWARERGRSVVRLSSSLARREAHRFYERAGYSNLKTEHAFAKGLDPTATARLGSLVPRVDPAG